MKLIAKQSIEINRGASGRAIALPMENSLLEAFYGHITMERAASAQYFAISLWFLEREFRGFSSYFYEECKSEQNHALEFCSYLVARGQTVPLEELSAPEQDFSSIEKIVSDVFQMESDVTSSLHQLYALAERNSDTRTNVFLDKIIEKQLSSEDEFAYLLGKVRFAGNDPSSLLIIDKELSIQN